MSAMENKSLAELLSQHATTAETPGALLQRARVAACLSEDEVAQQLRLLRSHVVAIEQDRYQDLQGTTFVKGYLRAYAQLVRVPVEQVLASFEQFSQRCPDKIPEAPRHVPRGPAQPFNTPAVVKNSWWIALAVLLAVGAGLWWYHRDARLAIESPAIFDALGTSDAKAPAEATKSEPLPARDALAQAKPEGDVEGDMNVPQPVAEASVAPAVATAGVTPPMAVSGGQLELRFTADCWAEVRDSKDTVLFSGMKKAGESVQLSGMSPLRIHLGNAEGVQISYNGQPVPVTADPVTKTARVVAGN